MDILGFNELLKKSEGKALDFKLQVYDFSNPDKDNRLTIRAEFVKDVISIANTPRVGSGYIVFGVKKHANGRVELSGIPEHIDDNEFQQKIGDWVFPHPDIRYHEVAFDGKNFGILEIVTDRNVGPYFATSSVKGGGEALKPGILYFRRSSQNSASSPPESHKIYKWFESGGLIPSFEINDLDIWTDFLDNAQLSEVGVRYILLLGVKNAHSYQNAIALATVRWGLVCDYDTASVNSGILSHTRQLLEQRRPLHVLAKGDVQSPSQSNAVYWYMSRGLDGRTSTLAGHTWKDWLSKYASDFRLRMRDFAASGTPPVVAIALFDDPLLSPHLKFAFEAATEFFGEGISLLLVTSNPEWYGTLIKDLDATLISLSPKDFLDGLQVHEAQKIRPPENLIFMPGNNGIKKMLEQRDVAWLEEDLELVHLNIGQDQIRSVDTKSFLRGGHVSWSDLSIGIDVERDISRQISNAVRIDLQGRLTTRINLFHKPGAGGTTISRRLGWQFREDFPCVVLKKCKPTETIERLGLVSQLTDRSLFIIREGNSIDDGSADELVRLLTSRNIPFCMLQVQRRHSFPSRTSRPSSTRSFFLDSPLSNREIGSFLTKLVAEAPNNREKLERLSRLDATKQTAFVYGLTAFENEFLGITSFVTSHLADLSEQQKSALLIFAMVHKYGHRPVSKEYFSQHFGLPHNRPVNIAKVMGAGGVGLLAQVDESTWRTLHELIAGEVIVQVLSPTRREGWEHLLTDAAIKLAEFLSPEISTPPVELGEIADRVFLFRDDSDPLTTLTAGANKFSKLFSDIPSSEARLRLFVALSERFRNRAHYWAHLGRFYSTELKRFDNAVEAIDRALDIDRQDHLLHHMKGMILRNELYSNIESKGSLHSLCAIGMRASACFDEARMRAMDDQYGYISEVQMLLRILDYSAIQSGRSAVVAASDSNEPWIREAFQRIEDLLDGVRQIRRGERPNEYEEKCRAQLETLYGSHSDALQRWQNLLDRKDGRGLPVVFAPPIRRQIVWTYLAKAGREWSRLSKKELTRSVELLELNMTEEPASEKNTRLWLQASRHLSATPTLDFVIEKVAYWRSQSDNIDACYYLYVLHAIQALSGSVLAAESARKEIEETKTRARFRRDRSFSFEWLGLSDGVKSLVHHDELGVWNETTKFWTHEEKLRQISGVITSIAGPQAGEIELPGGLRAFFVPSPAGIIKNRDENKPVTCYVGFSYDGPRAWSVVLQA